MSSLSAKTVVLTAVFAVGVMLSSTAHAAIVRTVENVPVLTNEGECVINAWEGSEGCAAAKAEAGLGGAVAPAPVAEAPKPAREAVVYFDFNKATLTAEAKSILNHYAKTLTGGKKGAKVYPQMTVVGYADRIGKADYNEKLAKNRAEAVAAYLQGKGVKAKKVEVRSLGKTAPKADCSADLPRVKLIECLREDRRVEIEVVRK